MNKHLQKKYKMKAPKVEYGTKVTQPDLSRTVRQILVDTALGKPSPISTHPLPDDDPQGKKNLDELHALRVTTDKFDAIEGARLYRLRARQSSAYWKNKFDESQKALREAKKSQKQENSNT